jgi:hypothetical protein
VSRLQPKFKELTYEACPDRKALVSTIETLILPELEKKIPKLCKDNIELKNFEFYRVIIREHWHRIKKESKKIIMKNVSGYGYKKSERKADDPLNSKEIDFGNYDNGSFTETDDYEYGQCSNTNNTLNERENDVHTKTIFQKFSGSEVFGNNEETEYFSNCSRMKYLKIGSDYLPYNVDLEVINSLLLSDLVSNATTGKCPHASPLCITLIMYTYIYI